MATTLDTLNTTYNSFAFEMTPEMRRIAAVEEGSIIVLTFENGKVSAEILPPIESEQVAAGLLDEYKHAFAEMKRLGD